MKALVYEGGRHLELREVPEPAVQEPDDVVVSVTQTGVCGTDRSVLVGKFDAAHGTIMGHEAVGIVSSAGRDVTTVRPGDRVVINPTLFCGTCAQCRQARFNHCLNKTGHEVGIDRHGSYAEKIVLPERFVNAIPDSISDDRATLIEPLCCALSNINAANPASGDRVLVLGGGPIGCLLALVARLRGCRVTVSELDSHRRKIIRSVFIDADFPDINVINADEIGSESEFDVAVDAVGVLLETAIGVLAPGGTAVTMGYNSHSSAQVTPLDLLFKGITITGAGDYNFPTFAHAIRLAEQLPLELLITHKLPLKAFDEALGLLSAAGGQYGAMKVVITSNVGASTTAESGHSQHIPLPA